MRPRSRTVWPASARRAPSAIGRLSAAFGGRGRVLSGPSPPPIARDGKGEAVSSERMSIRRLPAMLASPPPHARDAHARAVLGSQAGGGRRPPSLPPRRLLRDVLRGRRVRGAAPRPRPDRPPQGQRRRGPDVRHPAARARAVPRPARRGREEGRDQRADGGAGEGPDPRRAQDRPDRDARHDRGPGAPRRAAAERDGGRHLERRRRGRVHARSLHGRFRGREAARSGGPHGVAAAPHAPGARRLPVRPDRRRVARVVPRGIRGRGRPRSRR